MIVDVTGSLLKSLLDLFLAFLCPLLDFYFTTRCLRLSFRGCPQVLDAPHQKALGASLLLPSLQRGSWHMLMGARMREVLLLHSQMERMLWVSPWEEADTGILTLSQGLLPFCALLPHPAADFSGAVHYKSFALNTSPGRCLLLANPTKDFCLFF